MAGPTYTQVDIVSSPIGRDPDELIIAHYAPGKAPQANPEQLFTIQKVAKSRVRDASRVEIIGLHLPEDSSDDPFLWGLLDLMKFMIGTGRQVIYVNPEPCETNRARNYYRFETIQKTFQDHIASMCTGRRE